MPEIELTAGTIEYEDTGGDGPVLVLLGGLVMDGSVWDPLVQDLRADHRCVVPTLPLGASQTDAPGCRPVAGRLRADGRRAPAAARPARGHARAERPRRGPRPGGRRRRPAGAGGATRDLLVRGLRELPAGAA